MPLPLLPIAAVAAGLGVLYLVTKKPSAEDEAAAAKAKALAAGPAGFPPELQPELDRLLNGPPDQDPAALETVATRLEGLGFKEQATKLRLKAAQLRAAQGAAPPAPPAPPAPKATPAAPAAPAPTAPAETRFVPGVIDEPVRQAPAAPSRAHVPIPTRTLRDGVTGTDVKQWQEFLIFLTVPTVLGPKGADGVFGPLTKAATAAFQRSKALVDDGVAGPKTFAAAVEAGY